jgi:hypothetical protein
MAGELYDFCLALSLERPDLVGGLETLDLS